MSVAQRRVLWLNLNPKVPVNIAQKSLATKIWAFEELSLLTG
jgi:hypothetical protein